MDGKERAAGRWVSAAVIAATYLGMLALSWRKWPDVLVDFGQELYAAWQLSEGRALGRDVLLVATGPLPHYLNALVFRVFGASLDVLVAFNLAVLALLTALLFKVLRALSDRFAATLACVAFLSIFAFGQYVAIGNYNYVTPYSHGITHGLALSLLAILSFHGFAARGDRRLLVAAGLTVGLVFLTKPEIFLACAAAVGMRWVAFAWGVRSARRALEAFLVVLGAALVAPAIAVALLALQMPLTEAWRVTVTPWLLMATPFAKGPFYLRGMGLDAPAENAVALAAWAGGYACVVAAGVAAELAVRRLRLPPRTTGLAVFLAVGVALGLLVPVWGWLGVARPLPVVLLAGAGAHALRVFRARGVTPEGTTAALGLSMATFALALLGKMLLNARIIHYGFALAMPAFLLLVIWSTWEVPEYLKARGMSGAVFRGLSAGVLAVVAIAFVRMATYAFDAKRIAVGSGGDAFVADERGMFVAEAMRRIELFAPPGATLEVIPEGVMINYLTRRNGMSRYLSYLPDWLLAFGEPEMLSSLQRAPPDYVLIVSRDASEHGATTFGIDYAVGTMQWIRRNYAPVTVIGGSPFRVDQYGMMLLRRATPSGTPSGR